MFSVENNIWNGCDCSLDGLKLAKVKSNADSKAQERVWVVVLGVHDMDNTDPDYGIWCHKIAANKYSSGDIPDIGDWIYVMFIDGNPNICHMLGWVRNSK